MCTENPGWVSCWARQAVLAKIFSRSNKYPQCYMLPTGHHLRTPVLGLGISWWKGCLCNMLLRSRWLVWVSVSGPPSWTLTCLLFLSRLVKESFQGSFRSLESVIGHTRERGNWNCHLGAGTPNCKREKHACLCFPDYVLVHHTFQRWRGRGNGEIME